MIKKFVCEYMINKFVCEYMIKKEKMTMWINIFIAYAIAIVHGVVIGSKVFKTNMATRLDKV